MKKIILVFALVNSIFFSGCESIMLSNNNILSTSKLYKDEIINAQQAVNLLREGNLRFLNNKSEVRNVSKERRDELKLGQSPYATIISCSDSRVAPELIFNAGLGEIFDIRVAGNIINSDVLGSIEYAALYLDCPLILVIGHEKCGAVEATYNNVKNNEKFKGNINSIIQIIKPSVEDSNSLDEAIHKNIKNMAKEIEKSPILEKLIKENKLAIKTAYYSLDGKVIFED